MNNLTISERLAFAMAEMRDRVSPAHMVGAIIIGAGVYLTAQEMMISYDSAKAGGENLANVAATLAMVKAMLASCLVYIWISRKAIGWLGTSMAMIGCVIGMVVFHAYSFLAAADFAFAGRDKIVSGQELSAEGKKRLEDRYAAASKLVLDSSGVRPAAEVEAESLRTVKALEAANAQAQQAATIETAHASKVCGVLCKAAAADKSAAVADQKTLSRKLEALSVEMKSARQAEEARVEMKDLGTQLATVKAGRKDAEAYSKAVVLANLGFSINPENPSHVEMISLAKPIFQAIATEVGAFVTLLIGFAVFNSKRSPQVEIRIGRDGGEVVRATRIPDPLPLPAPMAPAEPSKEQLALEDLRGLIAASRGKVIDKRRQIAAHLEEETGRKFPVSTFCGWVNTWIEAKQILEIEENGQKYLALPFNARLAAAARKRELVAA